jgi:hypothetical protein
LLGRIGLATETEIGPWRAILIGSEVAMDAPTKHVYEVRPHKHHRGIDRISDVLPIARLLYGQP